MADDTAALQEQIDQAIGAFHLPRGVHLVRELTINQSNLRIYGNGSQSVLKLSPDASRSTVLRVMAPNVRVQDLRLNGNAQNNPATGNGTLQAFGDGLEVERLSVLNANSYGIQVVNADRPRIRDCTVSDVGDAGIAWQTDSSASVDIADAEITGNRVDRREGTHGHGISLHSFKAHRLARAKVQGNTVLMGAVGNGIELWGDALGKNGPANSIVSGNTVVGGIFGISVASSLSCAVTGNSLLNARAYGIEIASSDYAACSGNTVEGGGISTHGIVANDANGHYAPNFPAVSGNTIRGCLKVGIAMRGAFGSATVGNTIDQRNGGTGVQLFRGNYALVASNVIAPVAPAQAVSVFEIPVYTEKDNMIVGGIE